MHQLCVFYLPPPFQLGALPTPSSTLSESLSVQTQHNRAPSRTEGKVQVTFPEKGENEKECNGESAKQSKKAVSADLLSSTPILQIEQSHSPLFQNQNSNVT